MSAISVVPRAGRPWSNAMPCQVRPAAMAIVVSVAATALGGVDPAAAAYQVSMYSDA